MKKKIDMAKNSGSLIKLNGITFEKFIEEIKKEDKLKGLRILKINNKFAFIMEYIENLSSLKKSLGIESGFVLSYMLCLKEFTFLKQTLKKIMVEISYEKEIII